MFIKLLFSSTMSKTSWIRVQSTVQLIFINFLQINIQKISVIKCPHSSNYCPSFCAIRYCIPTNMFQMRLCCITVSGLSNDNQHAHADWRLCDAELQNAELYYIQKKHTTQSVSPSTDGHVPFRVGTQCGHSTTGIFWILIWIRLMKISWTVDWTRIQGFGHGGWKKKLDEHHPTKTEKLVRPKKYCCFRKHGQKIGSVGRFFLQWCLFTLSYCTRFSDTKARDHISPVLATCQPAHYIQTVPSNAPCSR